MSTVLVTGGTGFIGSHTVVCLIQAWYDVVIVDNLATSSATVIDSIHDITGIRPFFYEADIGDASALTTIFQKHTFSAVIHFAALKAVGESCADPFTYYQNNIIGTLTLLDVMQQYDVKTLLFSSSCTVYDTATSQPPFSETTPTGNTTNPYGTTKLIMEQILRDLWLHQGRATVALRYFNPIGAHPSGLIGERPSWTPTNIFPLLLETARGIRKEISIFGDDYPTPDGTCIRDYVHVMDIAQGHCNALQRMERQPATGYFEAVNLGTGHGTSVKELIALVEDVTLMKIPTIIASRRPWDTPSSVADPRKAELLFGRKAEYSMTDAVRHGRAFYQSTLPF